ncbi:PQQ-like beta-propeller repeat protein [Amycolatopsis sp. NBC_01488]|uniref:WD40 repeat domain-containing protein n=1 Tax=Amycolatopsis sp. NBC_01488 TaxID=2903563 RepID=UPI002E28608A|nr:PQQ-binding-like beta-propeller repeat protein [Amycolatopsis sp. NBC_01488]
MDNVSRTTVVSHYSPHFDLPNAQLAVGLDGNVYLASHMPGTGHALRLKPDGTLLGAGPVGPGTTAIAVNAGGVIATTQSFLLRRADVQGPDFGLLARLELFAAGDSLRTPCTVEAGNLSGAFYALDQRVPAVVRFDDAGQVERIPLTGLTPPPLTSDNSDVVALRVSESAGRFCLAWPDGTLRVTDLTGNPLWQATLTPDGQRRTAFDMAADGTVYVFAAGQTGTATKITVLNPDGTTGTDIPVPSSPFSMESLRILDAKTFLFKRVDPLTLFETYPRTGGTATGIAADVSQVSLTFPAGPWQPGAQLDLTVAVTGATGRPAPRLRCWLRPVGVPEFAELPATPGAGDALGIQVPADARGYYQLRVSPDVAGRYSEYAVDGLVEIRPQNLGSLAIFTPLNRFSYGQGEPVAVTVVPGTAPAPPASVHLEVRKDGVLVTAQDVPLAMNATAQRVQGQATFDSTPWQPGRYVLDATVPGFAVAPQYLEIGSAQRPGYALIRHGDYEDSFPHDPLLGPPYSPNLRNGPDIAAAHVDRMRRIGFTRFVDRLGGFTPTADQTVPVASALLDFGVQAGQDPAAFSADKLELEDFRYRSIAGYGAYGLEEQPILLTMDALVPLGQNDSSDHRTPDQANRAITLLSTWLKDYRGFRGWTWAANWWVAKQGTQAALPSEAAAYAAALKSVRDTGTWAAGGVLETVSDRVFALKPDVAAQFRQTLAAVDKTRVTAMPAPARALQTSPPRLFANVDEVDLHLQWEQLAPPMTAAFQVDYYRRPGKPVWGHPEGIANDDGTGGVILPLLLQLAMRGADGVGISAFEDLHQWGEPQEPRSGGDGPDPADPRSGGAGKISVLRAVFALLNRFGPLTAAARNANRVAIVVSTRMLRIEAGSGLVNGDADFYGYYTGTIGSRYFDALLEAYNACLMAHRPASFVFTEEVGADVLRQYDAVLLARQQVMPEDELVHALHDSTVQVYFDDACHPAVIERLSPAGAPLSAYPLGFAFDRIAREAHDLGLGVTNSEAAYLRHRDYYLQSAQGVRAALADVRPVAECDNPEVLLSEWTDGDVRYLWVVNNTLFDWEPGVMWRVSTVPAHRMPLLANLRVDVPPEYRIVDLLTGETVGDADGAFSADLRTVPGRMYAVAPPAFTSPVEPAPDLFGPHVRDLAVAADGSTAALTCFNWDHNVYGLDLETGATSWRRKLGHFFAFAPSAHDGGFAAMGYDLDTAEGYHLYSLGLDGVAQRRFALFGLPKKATDRAFAEWQYDAGLAAFATAPDGSWIATSGDLGLAVWNRADGSERWVREWWQTERTPKRLLAVDDDTLVTLADNTVTALAAKDGSPLWTVQAPVPGTFTGGTVSADGRTVVAWTNGEGGRVLVLRDGKLVSAIPTSASEVSVSGDGSLLVLARARQLAAYDAAGRLLWTYTGDDFLRRPRISPDGQRIAVGSELGSLVVLSTTGQILAETDLRALPVPAWLPGGDLLAATWMGTVIRFDTQLRPKWRTLLAPVENDARAALRRTDRTPTVRRSGWGTTARPHLPLTPNLLADTKALLAPHTVYGHALTDYVQPVWNLDPDHPPIDSIEWLSNDWYDGRYAPPGRPWLRTDDVNAIGSHTADRMVIEIDTYRTLLEVTGITVVEDPDHPESWLRDVLLQWFDIRAGVWRDGPMLLADIHPDPTTTPPVVHSHTFDPIRAARFRLASTGGIWPSGNLRLSELVFHGKTAGGSHRDVVLGNPVAVLFDEQPLPAEFTGGLTLRPDGGVGGGQCLELPAPGEAAPTIWHRQFWDNLRDWNFTISENPGRGEYRYLRFYWKQHPVAPGVKTGVSLRIGPGTSNPSLVVTAGTDPWPDWYRTAGTPALEPLPGTDWTPVLVDLWTQIGDEVPLSTIRFGAVGGGMLVDRILLGRTLDDLKAYEAASHP